MLSANFNSQAQISHNQLNNPSLSPDTLYFPFKDSIQLIVINSHDAYRRHGHWQDMMWPRGGSWFMDNPEEPPNAYIFRNRKGEITQVYNRSIQFSQNLPLRDTGYLNTNEISFDFIFDYTELLGNLKFFGPDHKEGLINLKGEVVAPAIYDRILRLYGYQSYTNKLMVVKDKQFGLLDSNAQVIFPPMYTKFKKADYVRSSQLVIDGENLKVFKDDRCGLISQEGEVLIDFQYDDIRLIHDSMYLALVTRPDEEVTQRGSSYLFTGYHVKACTVFDQHFQRITELEDYEYIMYNGIQQLIVKQKGKFGLLNHLGEVIIPLEYESLVPQDGVYHVRKAGKMGAFSLNGDLVLPCVFEQIQFYGPAIYTTKNGLVGVYNRNFELIADHQFERRHWDMGKYILTRPNGSEGFVMHEKDNTYYRSPEGKIIKL